MLPILYSILIAGVCYLPYTPPAPVIQPQPKVIMVGQASFYDYTLKSGWSSFGHLVCAARDFKRNSMLTVINKDNGKSVICKITDFGPDEAIFPERIVDLSSYAFSQLAPLSRGLINVEIYDTE
jgi:rare lipoprotein A (peptidoglycan hydrolase)